MRSGDNLTVDTHKMHFGGLEVDPKLKIENLQKFIDIRNSQPDSIQDWSILLFQRRQNISKLREKKNSGRKSKI